MEPLFDKLARLMPGYKRHVAWILSIVFVSFVSFKVGGFYYTTEDAEEIGEYDRGTHDFVAELDVLATLGRTNDVHQLSQKYLDGIFIGPKGAENLEKLVEDAYEKTQTQPNKSLQPTATAPSASTNK